MFWTKRVFSSGDPIAVDVRDVAAAQGWYEEKMGLHYASTDLDKEEGSIKLGYSAEETFVYLVEDTSGRRPSFVPGHPPILFVSKLSAAHEFLSSRGANVGPLLQDSGGNHFFRFRDLDDNELEVCQET
jgi:catechol 2,3-dioxygenase-like lactoylglutathione lyase family enzyme